MCTYIHTLFIHFCSHTQIAFLERFAALHTYNLHPIYTSNLDLHGEDKSPLPPCFFQHLWKPQNSKTLFIMIMKVAMAIAVTSTGFVGNSFYLLTRSYVNKTCSGPILSQKSEAVNLCERNSYSFGTFRIECVDKPGTQYDTCTREHYPTTPDCSGASTTVTKFDASGQCTENNGIPMTYLIVADADVQSGFSRPVLRQWQDESCVGTPVEYIDYGICHGWDDNSYRYACMNGTVQKCQYHKSNDCTGNGALCVPDPGVITGKCTARGKLGGKASVQYDC